MASSCSQNKTCHLVCMDFLFMYNIPVQCCRPLFSSVQLFSLPRSSVIPSFLHLHGFIFTSASPEICRSFCTLCLLKSFSSSATRSTDLQVFSHSLHNYQFHHYLYLRCSACSAFYCSHLQACFPYSSVNKHQNSRTVRLFSFLSLISPQMFVKPKRENWNRKSA